MYDWSKLILDLTSGNLGTLITNIAKGAVEAQIAESGHDAKDKQETKQEARQDEAQLKKKQEASVAAIRFPKDTLLGNADLPRGILDPSLETKTCYGTATFSAIGPGQASNDEGALRIKPPYESVAINPKVFGFPYATLTERGASQNKIIKHIDNIEVHAPELAKYLTGDTTFTIGDAGDKHILNSPVPRYDIYRFATHKDAMEFGIKKWIPVTITGVPKDWKCPE